MTKFQKVQIGWAAWFAVACGFIFCLGALGLKAAAQTTAASQPVMCHADAGTMPARDKAAAICLAERALGSAPASQPRLDIPKGADDLGSLMRKLSEAWKGSNWRLLIVGGFVVLLYFLRRWGSQFPGKVGEWVASDRGGAWLTIATVVAFTLFVALGGGGLDWDKLVDAILGACAVAGAYVLPKRAAAKE